MKFSIPISGLSRWCRLIDAPREKHSSRANRDEIDLTRVAFRYLLIGHYKISLYTACFQMLVVFLRWFLDGISTYALAFRAEKFSARRRKVGERKTQLVKGNGNIYYCSKNQVRGWCVGGDMVILLFGLFHGKMTIYPPAHNPRTWYFPTVIDMVNISYI